MFGSVLLRPQHNSNWKVTATWLLVGQASLIGQGRKLLRRQGFATGASNPWPGATRYPISAEYCIPPRSSSFSIALYVPAKLTNPQTFIIILALLYKPHAHSWFHWRSSTAQGYKHYFYSSQEEAAPELEGPWTVGQKRKSGAGTTPRKGLWSGGARPLPTLPQPGAFPDNPPALDWILWRRLPSLAAPWAVTSRLSPGFPKPGKPPPKCASRPATRSAYRTRPHIYRHPKGYPRTRIGHWAADSGSQRPPVLGHHRSSHPPAPGPPLRSQAALAAHRAGNLFAPALTSSAGAAARWRARAAEKMSPTPPLFSLPEARTRFTVSGRRVGAALAQR